MASYSTCTEVSLACPVSATTYGYYPNLGGNIFFAVFFGIIGVCQIGLGIYFRTWTFMIALSIGVLMEMAGYVGRILMHSNPWSIGNFDLQIVCLVLAPAFIAAGIYLFLKHIILFLGPEYSRLSPRLYTWIFIGCDIGSLVLQAAGGGIAASAKKTNHMLLQTGDDVIIAGIAFQVVTMSVCGLLGLEFFSRVRKQGGGFFGEKDIENGSQGRDRNVGFACVAVMMAYVAVLIRCIYR
jgi:RTA1 like protein